MTYLFKNEKDQTYVEIEATANGVKIKSQEYLSPTEHKTVEHQLNKKELFHLIGALHLIQKEIKGGSNV